MIPELGHFALIVAFCLALAQCVLPLAGYRLGRHDLMAVAAPAAIGQFLFMALSFAALAWAFYSNDFTVAYVAANSNTHLPWYYRLPAVWGSHEGSLLLWVMILATWTFAVALYSRSLPRHIGACVLAVMGAVSTGFILFTLVTSNPFTRQFPAPAQGRDLNPLLQDPGMIGHPPMLYMGYVGFAVAFAFAITALITGRADSAWTRWARPWTTAAWLFLTAGVTLGSWWSYHVLGWGGWWFWDPVENASFMPWLVGTALIHSLAVTEKRGIFQSWTVLLAIFAFSLSLLGTFIVRSGILISVHAFAVDPQRGTYVLAFFTVVVGGSLLLYAIRAPRLAKGDTPVAVLSREGLLLLNNIFLVVAAAAVLIGTLYPLLAQGLGLGRISVGPPYFDRIFVPLMIPLILLLGFGAAMAWKRTRAQTLGRRLWLPAIAAVAAGATLSWLAIGTTGVAAVAGCALGAWAIATAAEELWRRGRPRRWPRGVLGMSFAHAGVGVTVIGICLVSAFGVERDVRLAPGESTTVAGYTFRFDGTGDLKGPNYSGQVGRVDVRRHGNAVTVLQPEKRQYDQRASIMTEAAVSTGVFRDLYVSLGQPLAHGAWSMRIYYRPFVNWIWFGGLLMALGGLLAVSDSRYRKLRRREYAAQDLAAEGARA